MSDENVPPSNREMIKARLAAHRAASANQRQDAKPKAASHEQLLDQLIVSWKKDNRTEHHVVRQVRNVFSAAHVVIDAVDYGKMSDNNVLDFLTEEQYAKVATAYNAWLAAVVEVVRPTVQQCDIIAGKSKEATPASPVDSLLNRLRAAMLAGDKAEMKRIQEEIASQGLSD